MKKNATMANENDGVIVFGFGPRRAINNKISLCQVDIQVCCIPLPDSRSNPDHLDPVFTPKNPKKCGINNKRGIENGFLDIHPKFPQMFTTHFGEWPHHCMIFDAKSTLLKGGASLIAPGVILTAAHKVWLVSSFFLHLIVQEHDL